MDEKKILTTYYGEWGDMRREYLHREKPERWQELLKNRQLHPYLLTFGKMMEKRASKLEAELMEKQGVTEALKRQSAMSWVRRYNNVREQVRELMMEEVTA
jgi:hypothetical protein